MIDKASNKWVVKDFTQEELLKASQVLSKSFLDILQADPVLAKLIHTLHSEILQEVFIKFAKGDPEKEKELRKVFNEGH
jgi:hypothetical protein